MPSIRFHEILQDMWDIHQIKSEDYGGEDPFENIRESTRLGITPYKGVLIRMGDKWSRLVNLSRKEASVKDETIGDTLLDMACYSVIALIMWEEEKNKGE